jgi:thymidylate synthase
MIVFNGKTFAEAYSKSIEEVLKNGIINSARGTTSRELLDVALVVENPRSCLYQNEVRGSQLDYIAGEFLWYYMGRNDVKFISKWAKFWEQIQNPDGTANSAYGNLIFKRLNQYGLTQYSWVVNSLIKDPSTRQAIMHFNTPDHQYFTNKDFVCTMYASFSIRNNKLNMSVFMRSNDAIWGTPTDVAFFGSLHLQLLSHLSLNYPGLELGTYTHFANSYHIYDRHYDISQRMLEKEFIPMDLPEITVDLINIDGTPTEDFKLMFNAVTKDPDDMLIFQNGNDLLKWIFDKTKNKK